MLDDQALVLLLDASHDGLEHLGVSFKILLDDGQEVVQLLFGVANLAQDITQLGQVKEPNAFKQGQKAVYELKMY